MLALARNEEYNYFTWFPGVRLTFANTLST